MNLLKENGYLYECFETEEELENIKNLKKAQKKAPIITKEDCIKEGKNGYWRFEIKNNSFELNDIVFGKMKFNKNIFISRYNLIIIGAKIGYY